MIQGMDVSKQYCPFDGFLTFLLHNNYNCVVYITLVCYVFINRSIYIRLASAIDKGH